MGELGDIVLLLPTRTRHSVTIAGRMQLFLKIYITVIL